MTMDEPPAGAPIGAPSSPAPAGGAGVGSRTRRRVGAILVVLCLVSALGYWYLAYGSVSTEVETIGQGRRYVDLPAMTFYSPPPPIPDAVSEVTVKFGRSSSIDYRWSAPDANGTPVEFVLLPSTWFDAPAPNVFRWTLSPLSDSTSYGSSVTGYRVRGGIVHAVAMDYIVKRITLSSALSSRTWLQVEYSLASSGVVLDSLPFRNVTVPGASDILSVGSERLEVFGNNWRLTWSLAQFDPPGAPFRDPVGSFEFDGGRYGTIAANITSQFMWGPNDDCVMALSGSGDAVFNLTWAWDMRFGSLLSE